MHFGYIFAIRFADCQHRLTRSELTANIKNIQISAEICKEQTQIKNADIKTLIDHLRFAECNQLHQSPSSNYGGGGARAAWRIRIHIRRLLRNMCEASVALAIERSAASRATL